MDFPNGYDKSKAKLGDHVDQFCDHRAECGAKCSLRPTSEVDRDADIAYPDEVHCERFRTAEDGIVGADVVELGVWK